jgi:threonine dehydratase
MPVTTPFVKVKATEALGATVIRDGETLAEV